MLLAFLLLLAPITASSCYMAPLTVGSCKLHAPSYAGSIAVVRVRTVLFALHERQQKKKPTRTQKHQGGLQKEDFRHIVVAMN
jgi:hypothetical protein